MCGGAGRKRNPELKTRTTKTMSAKKRYRGDGSLQSKSYSWHSVSTPPRIKVIPCIPCSVMTAAPFIALSLACSARLLAFLVMPHVFAAGTPAEPAQLNQPLLVLRMPSTSKPGDLWSTWTGFTPSGTVAGAFKNRRWRVNDLPSSKVSVKLTISDSKPDGSMLNGKLTSANAPPATLPWMRRPAIVAVRLSVFPSNE